VSVALFRIDERLIHGQVVVGWGATTQPDRIIVVDDPLSVSEWEQELYRLGLPATVSSEFASVAEARAQLPAWQESGDRIIVLTRDAATMLALAAGGLLDGVEINIGGIHHAPGRRQVLPYVYLSDEEAAALRALGEEGARVSARDLPAAKRVPLRDLLNGDAAT
jgi:mannose/fructose/N-acetylgalactosamine-specific phosphotransferase system component IIB